MKMLFCVFLVLQMILPQGTSGESRATAALTFRVTDDAEKPVSGATVAASTFHHWERGEAFGKDISETFVGTTNERGIVSITGQSLRGDFNYGVRPPEGFYRGGGGDFRFTSVVAGKWHPWNPTIDLLIRRLGNPVAMYARKVGALEALRIPLDNKPIGFDLIASDWVALHGKGTISDVVFKLERSSADIEQSFDATLTITFANEGDGIQIVPTDQLAASELKLPRFAPEKGYGADLVTRKTRRDPTTPVETNPSMDQNYFLRVRTVLDER